MSINRSRDLLPLLVMLESVEKILLYAKGFQTAKDFLWADDQLRFNASLLLLSNIGENSGKISEITRSTYPAFPWKQVRGLRNRIAHDYTGIDYEMVFEIVNQQIPRLKVAIEEIIKDGLATKSFDKSDCKVAQESVFYRHIDFERLV
ncbi:DUF86 domain-containing protein [Runella sp. SP2]|nr:DUF86 domain-containing protein [Runella sp. SP2]